MPTELAARAELAQLLAADRPAEAEEHLARCDEILAGGEDWRGLRRAGRAGPGRGRRGARRRRRGRRRLARAVEVFTAFGLPWHEADALATWGRLLADRGSADEAAERLSAGAAGLRRHRCRRPVDRRGSTVIALHGASTRLPHPRHGGSQRRK